MTPTLFLEKKVNKTLKKKGFVRLPFLSTSAVESLRLAFMGHKQSIGEGFCATMFSDDMEYRQWANEIICQALNAGFTEHFQPQFHLLYANFMVKYPGEASKMPLHQDWTYIEETQNYRSYAVWIPLQDLHAENGSLEVLEGSHRAGNQWRGPGTTCPFQEHEALIREQGMLSAQHLKAGEAIVWDHRLAHASPPNLTDTPRIAVTAIITPKDKQTLHCVVSDEAKDHGHIILTDTSFYTQYTIGEITNYPRSAAFQREYAKTTLLDIKRWREKALSRGFLFSKW